MNKLIKYSLAITLSLLLLACDNFNENKEFSCIGETSEIQEGTAVPNHRNEIKSSDTLSLSIKNGYVTINGSNILPPAALANDDKYDYGFKFKICKNENHVIDFNNYGCDDKNILLPQFFIKYVGSLNGINNKFTLETFKDYLHRYKDLETSYIGNYSCKVVKPSF